MSTKEIIMTKKLVVITGASSGFGRALAVEFNKDGHPLLLVSRNIQEIEGLENVMYESVDVRDKDALEKAIRNAEAVYGKTDLIINNAGVMLLGDIASQDANEWQQMVDVNVMGVLNGMQIVMNDMKERKSGTIINLASIAGVKAFPNHAAYCATKYGVVGLSETVRGELAAHNVRVIRICPGAVDTNLLSHTTRQDIKDGYHTWKEACGIETITAEHVAKTIKFAYDMPQGVTIREIQIADTKQDA